ncbi:MAG: tetratricopeptide repeat protein [Gammaproteobacteria bacterium]
MSLLNGCAGWSASDAEQERARPPSEVAKANSHILLAEIALQRADYAAAATEYRTAALLSTDVELAERATRINFEFGQDRLALECARHWYSLDPDDLAVHSFLARLYVRHGKPDEAARHLRTLYDMVSDDGSGDAGYLALLDLLMDERDQTSASRAFAELVRHNTDSARAQFSLGTLALGASNSTLALESAGKALELEPGWQEATMLIARALIAGDQATEGLAQAEAVIKDSDDLSLHVEYAFLLAEAGREEEARRILQELREEQPEDPLLLRSLGFLQLRADDYDNAQNQFSALLATGNYVDDAFYYMAWIAEQRQEFPRALRLYSRITSDNNFVSAQIRISEILRKLGDTEASVQHLEDVAQVNPRYTIDMIAAAGSLHSELGDYESALATYNRGLDRYPDNEPLLYGRAFLYERYDQIGLAIDELRIIVKNKPDDPVALNALGYTLADRTTRYREARRHVRKALSYAPDNPAIIDSMGWIEYRQGNLDAARTHLERAWRLSRDPEIAAHLGEVIWQSGDETGAITIWELAQEEDEDSEILRDTMGRFVEAPSISGKREAGSGTKR